MGGTQRSSEQHLPVQLPGVQDTEHVCCVGSDHFVPVEALPKVPQPIPASWRGGCGPAVPGQPEPARLSPAQSVSQHFPCRGSSRSSCHRGSPESPFVGKAPQLLLLPLAPPLGPAAVWKRLLCGAGALGTGPSQPLSLPGALGTVPCPPGALGTGPSQSEALGDCPLPARGSGDRTQLCRGSRG